MYHELMSFFPSLRIHIWGGLGSQLYGWALAEIIRKKTKRTIVLVLHTSGVTRRISDLDFLSKRFIIEQVEDFSPVSSTGGLPVPKSYKRFLRFLTKILGFILTDSELGNDIRIFPWTRAIRGHYTNVKISNEIINLIISVSSAEGLIDNSLLERREYLIHYRLGDLLFLGDKKPIPPNRFVSLPIQATELSVVSDSLPEAIKALSTIFGFSINGVRTPTAWDTLNEILNCKVFVGTPSKISFWGIAMRKATDPNSECYLTREHIDHLRCLTNSKTFSLIKPY